MYLDHEGNPRGMQPQEMCFELEFVLRFIMNLTKILGTSQTDMTLIPWWMVFAVYQSSPMLSISTGLCKILRTGPRSMTWSNLWPGACHVQVILHHLKFMFILHFHHYLTNTLFRRLKCATCAAAILEWSFKPCTIEVDATFPYWNTMTFVEPAGSGSWEIEGRKHNGVNSS